MPGVQKRKLDMFLSKVFSVIPSVNTNVVLKGVVCIVVRFQTIDPSRAVVGNPVADGIV